MKALYFDKHGELDVVKYGEVPDPDDINKRLDEIAAWMVDTGAVWAEY